VDVASGHNDEIPARRTATSHARGRDGGVGEEFALNPSALASKWASHPIEPECCASTTP
jgi:hypothetical protein